MKVRIVCYQCFEQLLDNVNSFFFFFFFRDSGLGDSPNVIKVADSMK
jgi:hypothetical protein